MRILNVAESRDMAPIALHYPQAPSKPMVIPSRVKEEHEKQQEQALKEMLLPAGLGGAAGSGFNLETQFGPV